mgnify:CR=1 FL=1
MEESKFQKEKADLQRILQEEIERIGAEGIEKENIARVGIIAWITSYIDSDESYTKSQLRELFALLDEKSPWDATWKALQK